MAFWVKYWIRRFLIFLRMGGCMGEYVLHCYHVHRTKIPIKGCFAARAEGITLDGYFYKCCRCQKTTKQKVTSHAGY